MVATTVESLDGSSANPKDGVVKTTLEAVTGGSVRVPRSESPK